MSRLCLFLTSSLLFNLSANAGILIVAYMAESKVVLVDSVAYKTIATLDTGTNPHEVRVAPDKLRVYVAAGKTITVVDLKRRRVAANFNLGSYSAHDIRISRDGSRIWAACGGQKAILELDSTSGKIIKAYNTDRPGSWFVEVTPDDKKLYTPNMKGKSVSVINRATGEVKVIPLEFEASGIEITPDGRKV